MKRTQLYTTIIVLLIFFCLTFGYVCGRIDQKDLTNKIETINKEIKEIKEFQIILANYNTDRVLCDYDRISDKFDWYYEAGINATLKPIGMPTYDGSQFS